MSVFLSKFYEVIIGFLLILVLAISVWGGWQKYNRTIAETKVLNAEVDKKKAVADALKPYLDAEARGREIAKEVAEKYITKETSEQKRVEKITNEVQIIKERPIYLNTCFDDDGVRNVNALRYTSEPETKVP